MTLTSLSSSDIKEIAKLVRQKEALQTRIVRIERRLAAFEKGEEVEPAPKRRRKARIAGARRAKRGKLKQAIMEVMTSAGGAGITVKEIADNVGVDSHRVHRWLAATGKKLKQIKRVGRGKYAWDG